MTAATATDDILQFEQGALCLRVSRRDGRFSLSWAGETVFSNACFRVDQQGEMLWRLLDEDLRCDANDDGVTLTWTPQAGYAPVRRLTLRLREDALEFAWGVRNPHRHPLRVRDVDLLFGATLGAGADLDSARHLVMGAGAEPNPVVADWRVEADNGVMLTWLRDGRRRCLVLGGLRYHAFARRVTISAGVPDWKHGPRPRHVRENERCLGLRCWDPHGVTVPPGADYDAPDTAWLAVGEDPFHELERYARALAQANDARPNEYNFPTLCGWMVSTQHLGEGRPINDSTGLVRQCELARERGLMDYTPLALRLEPDHYAYGTAGDTQQGWWDDEHWRRYGALTEPYPTMAAFGAALQERGGIPFTYLQSSMPSNDFAATHPEWMLGGDISELHREHTHQRPHVRYDYTAPGFQAHCLAAWRRLRDAGIHGIKFDYPETAWNPRGGFSDRQASTTQAYRAMFALCREGLGPEARIHERNLGGETHESAPRLDATAGLVDLQRVWGDASHFEPEMAARIGLRWYKSRRVFRYYPDGKSFYRDGVPLPAHERRAFLSLIAFLSGRLEIGTSIGRMDDAMFRDLTRVFPMLPGSESPRPTDLLLGKPHPESYALRVDEDLYQVLLVNNDASGSRRIAVPLSGPQCETGSLGLDPRARYHAHEFWSQRPLGCLPGDGELGCQLRGGEVAMLALRRAADHPQLIGTDRHLYQGMLECHELRWDPATRRLEGLVDLVAGDPVVLTVACNGPLVPAGEHACCGQGVHRISVPAERTGRQRFSIAFTDPRPAA
jgi:hypothetical protein